MKFKEKIKKEYPREWEKLKEAEKVLEKGNFITPSTFQRISSCKVKIFNRLMEEE